MSESERAPLGYTERFGWMSRDAMSRRLELLLDKATARADAAEAQVVALRAGLEAALGHIEDPSDGWSSGAIGRFIPDGWRLLADTKPAADRYMAQERERAVQAADALDAWGDAVRGSWADFDGRTAKAQLRDVSAFLRGEADGPLLVTIVCREGALGSHWFGDANDHDCSAALGTPTQPTKEPSK